LPLQCLCQAIFDAILVHVMCALSPDGRWQEIKTSIVDAVFSKKHASTLRLLGSTCAGADVIFLQESAANFKDAVTKALGAKYHVIGPEDVDPNRDQNSLVLLSKLKFPSATYRELTASALKVLGTNSPVERGDLLAIFAQSAAGEDFVLASFHGDTNGMATKPVVHAVAGLLGDLPRGCRLVFGLDANTYMKPREGMQGVEDFLDYCTRFDLRTCFQDGKDLSECFTCCNARTFLQPQLNKAIRSSDKLSKGDLNPKDHILFQRNAYEVLACYKDNTGQRRYVERECFPTLHFPSDHGIVCAVLKPCVAVGQDSS